MPRWEYRQLIRATGQHPGGQVTMSWADSHGETFSSSDAEMQVVNQLGRDGWEMFSLTTNYQQGEVSGGKLAATSMWFKRPLGASDSDATGE